MKRKFLLLLPLIGLMALYGCKGDEQPKLAESVKVITQSASVNEQDATAQYSGTIEEESGSSLSFSAMGTLHRIYVDEGQMVSRGTLLAEIDPASVRNAYEATLAARKQAEDAYSRMKQLHEAGSLPEIKWIEVTSKLQQAVASEQIARKNLTDCKLYAPYSGYIAKKSVEMGQNVAPGVEVVKLVRIDQVKVKVSIPEEEIGDIRTGETAEVRVEALGGRTFNGKVVEKGVEANPLSRTYDVKIALKNDAHDLLPGMVCDVSLKTAQQQTSPLVLPAQIVQIDVDNRPFVWTVVHEKAHKVYVTLGTNVGNNVVITQGLSAQDLVIIKGQQKVSEGTRVVTGGEGQSEV